MGRRRKYPVRNVVIPLKTGDKEALQACADGEFVTLQTWLLQYVRRAIAGNRTIGKVERVKLSAPGTDRLFLELPEPVFQNIAGRTERKRPVDVAEWILGSLQPLLAPAARLNSPTISPQMA